MQTFWLSYLLGSCCDGLQPDGDISEYYCEDGSNPFNEAAEGEVWCDAINANYTCDFVPGYFCPGMVPAIKQEPSINCTWNNMIHVDGINQNCQGAQDGSKPCAYEISTANYECTDNFSITCDTSTGNTFVFLLTENF